MRLIVNFVGLFLLLTTLNAHAEAEIPNLQTSAALDITAPIDFDHSDENKLDIRSAELFFKGPIDSLIDASLNFAAHNENGEYKAEIHEATLGSSKLIPASRFKVGKFILGVGQLNQAHQHDWPFTSAPRVQKEFLAEGALFDSGLEFSTLLPMQSHWEITVGVTNGFYFNTPSSGVAKPHTPLHYIHPVNSVDMGDSGDVRWGFNYLGQTNADQEQIQLWGLDFSYKKTEGHTPVRFMQSEIWYRKKSSPISSFSEEVGAYFFPQTSLSETQFVGVRLDVFSDLSRKFPAGGSQGNLNYAIVPTWTAKWSEYSLFRISYSYDMQTYEKEADRMNQKLEFQFVGFLGAPTDHEH